MLRLRSAEYPFLDARVAGQAARLLALVEAIGIWEPPRIVRTLDGQLFTDALGSLAEAGLVSSAPLDWAAYADKTPEDFSAWIRGVREVILTSPVPEVELPKLDVLFGNDRLASLVGVGSSSLRRYLAKDREVPDDVANRVHLVARVVGDLAGSYNDRGIRRWFERPRTQLNGQSPEEILNGQWDTDDPEVTRVANLAADLVG